MSDHSCEISAKKKVKGTAALVRGVLNADTNANA